MNPRQLLGNPRVVLRRNLPGRIETACRHVDLIGEKVVSIGQLGTAVRAKCPYDGRAAREVRRVTTNEAKPGLPDAKPGDKWSGRRAAAIGAVANGRVEGRSRDLVADVSAQATASKHCFLRSGLRVIHRSYAPGRRLPARHRGVGPADGEGGRPNAPNRHALSSRADVLRHATGRRSSRRILNNVSPESRCRVRLALLSRYEMPQWPRGHPHRSRCAAIPRESRRP
jgi:hypothetical protein